MMSTLRSYGVMRAALLLLALLLVAPVAAAEPVAVSPTGDAHADGVAVSGTGNATSSCREFGTIPCATVSVFGDAHNGNRVEVSKLRACLAAGLSGICPVDGSVDVAGVVEVDPTGDADGTVAVAPAGDAAGPIAIGRSSEGAIAIATEDAHGTAAVGGESAVGYAAVAGEEARAEGCITVPREPCVEGVAVSIGNASSDMAAASASGHADAGFVAVSGGSAHARCDRFGTLVCAAVAANGDGSGRSVVVEQREGRVCVMFACAGPDGTSGLLIAEVSEGDSRGEFVAVSRDGTARSNQGLALSLHGDAEGWRAAVAPEGRAWGGVAVSIHGTSAGGLLSLSLCGGAERLSPSTVAVEGRPLTEPACTLLLQ